MEQDERQTFQLGGKTFWMAPPVARQQKWLWPIVKPIFLAGSIEGDRLLDLLFEQGAAIAAIVLIEDGQTQAQKVEAGASTVHELETWLNNTVQAADLAPVLQAFFTSGQLQQMVQALAGLLPTSLTIGLTKPSSS